jgi:non-ribosomal peptide synthase protein (TIGR01720 family)
VMRGCLTLNWTYSTSFHSRETVESLAGDFVKELRAIIAHCVDPDSAGFTPSDFPLARLDAAKLDRIERALARGNRKGFQPKSRSRIQ